jgi:carboxymethylenebutenolidase
MRPEHRAIDVGRRVVDAELYRPADGAGPWPGVLLLHELFGLTSAVRADARHLAREGFLVLAPDLFSGGMARYCMKFFFSREALANTAEAEPVREIHELLDALAGLPACNGRLGMIGMCLTGGFVLQMARRDDLLAPVVYHHAFGVGGSGLPAGDAADVRHVVQGHFAAVDPLCPRGKVAALSRQLGDRLEAHVYDGAGHGLRSQFRHAEPARQAWERTLAFFRRHLVVAAAGDTSHGAPAAQA